MRRSRSGRSSAVSVEAVTAMPGVQKPHWKPKCSMSASCTGWSSSPGARPLAVVICEPSTRGAGMRHECTGAPSRITAQAPQSPASQPFLTS
jgi:hypothetical protein